MAKSFHKYATIIITILTADLLSLYALLLLNNFRSSQQPYQSAAVTMGVAICIFYPALQFLHKRLKTFSGKVLNHGSKLTGTHLLGRFISFLLIILLLWSGFVHVLYQRNVFADTWQNIKELIP